MTQKQKSPSPVKRSLAIIGQAMAREYLRTDLAIEDSLKSVTHSCVKGCAGCCRMLLTVSLEETVAIAAIYPHKLRAKRKQLTAQSEKLKVLYTRVFGEGPDVDITNEQDLAAYTEKNDALCALWWAENEPCVFLKEDNSCAVYDARPTACRGYYVVSDPELCFLPNSKVGVLALKAAADSRGRQMDAVAGDVVSFAYAPTQLLAALSLLDKE